MTLGGIVIATAALLSCVRGDPPRTPEAQPEALAESRTSDLPRLVTNAERPWMLTDNVTPKSYELELELDPSKDNFVGRVSIAVEIHAPSATIVLHARGLEISTAAVSLVAANSASVAAQSLPATVTTRSGADERAAHDLIELDVGKPISGEASIQLSFVGHYREDMRGLYKVQQRQETYVFSQLQPMDARSVFPCFDEPHHKTPFSIRIRTPNAETRAFSNTPESASVQSDGSVIYDFATSQPMPTYLVAFAAGPLDVRPEPASEPPSSTPIRLITPKGKAERGTLALQAATRHLAALEKYFGSPYPYAKLDVVAVPEFAAGAMENVGLVTFREERLLLTEASAAGEQSRMTDTMAHELAHMWFGNLVTMKWWDEVWLNEGFATWMANKMVAQEQPEFQSAEDYLGWLGWAMWEDSLPTARAIRQQVRTQTDTFRAFGGLTYAKGFAVLGMVEEWTGQEKFQAGIRRYIEAHAWGNATSRDLFVALGGSQYPVAAVMDSFTTKPGVPMVDLRTNCRDGTLAVEASQTAYTPIGTTPSDQTPTWLVPICIRFEEAEHSRKECHLLTGSSANWSIPVSQCPTWVIPNADQSGYYRSHLEREAIDALVGAAPVRLQPKEQVGLLMDLTAALDAARLPMDDYLGLATHFFQRAERRVAAWGHILSVAGRLRVESVEALDLPAFERWLRALLAPPLKRLTLESKKNEPIADRMLRSVLIGAAGHSARDPRVIQRALTRTRQWLKAPGSVPGDEAVALVALAASTNQRDIFDGLHELARNNATAEHRTLALRALGHVTQPELASELLQEVASGELPPADARHALGTLLGERRLRHVTYPWFTQNFDTLVGSIPLFALRHFVRGAIARCTMDDRAEIERFFTPRLESLEGMDGVLAESREGAQRCAAYREHHAQGLHDFLSRQ